LKISIVVPTYNEQKDIAGTLEALIALDYVQKEILIVDDSTDDTPAIVQSYEKQGVVLIRPGGGGRCEARNLGITKATGDIVCILNADVRPRRDFLQRVAKHYQDGADYLLVGSRISNRDDLFARYVDCASEASPVRINNPDWPLWTEGFSCRRDMAIRAGLFPTGFAVPICAGEDAFFGMSLRDLGARKVVDLSIVVDHVAPSSFKEYWSIRRGRGTGSAQMHRFLDHWSFPLIIVWNILKSLRTAVYSVLLFPSLWICWKICRYSERGYADLIPFLYAWNVEQLAFHVGEWRSVFELMKKQKEHAADRG